MLRVFELLTCWTSVGEPADDEVTVTDAVADLVVSAWLVAVTEYVPAVAGAV